MDGVKGVEGGIVIAPFYWINTIMKHLHTPYLICLAIKNCYLIILVEVIVHPQQVHQPYVMFYIKI